MVVVMVILTSHSANAYDVFSDWHLEDHLNTSQTRGHGVFLDGLADHVMLMQPRE